MLYHNGLSEILYLWIYGVFEIMRNSFIINSEVSIQFTWPSYSIPHSTSISQHTVQTYSRTLKVPLLLSHNSRWSWTLIIFVRIPWIGIAFWNPKLSFVSRIATNIQVFSHSTVILGGGCVLLDALVGLDIGILVDEDDMRAISMRYSQKVAILRGK